MLEKLNTTDGILSIKKPNVLKIELKATEN